LRAAMTGAMTVSASFFSAIGAPNLPIGVRAPDNIINSAGGRTQHVGQLNSLGKEIRGPADLGI